MTLSVSHIGICVADLDRSRRFYCEGLGFEVVGAHRVGSEFGRLMEVEQVEVESVMIAKDGVTIELLGFVSPQVTGEGIRRPMNRRGLTHICLRVDDVDRVAADIESLGGTVVRTTRTTLDLSGTELDFLYCTDPDGVRIELMDLTGRSGGSERPPERPLP